MKTRRFQRLKPENPTAIALGIHRYRTWLKFSGLDEKPHQISGMQWCLKRELRHATTSKIRGGLIADEMGLGKTILLMGLIVSNFKLRTLIIVPLALLEQWKRAIKMNFNHDAFIYHGSGLKKLSDFNDPVKGAIVLTTYGIVLRQKVDSPLFSRFWDRLICDEAHHFRNRGKLFEKALKFKADIKWMVTGTPMQNRPSDLFALFKILQLKITLAYTHGISPVTKSIILDHLLKRTKKGVGIKLPELKMHYIEVPWKSAAEKFFCAEVHSHLGFPGLNFRNINRITSLLGNGTFAWLTRVRQVCILPHLLEKTINKLIEQGDIDIDTNLDHIKTASKLTAIVNMLSERARNGRRKLVFCHYHGEIDLLQHLLEKIGISTAVIDGRGKKKDRQFITMPVIRKMDFILVCKKWHEESNPVYDLISEFLAPQVCLVQIQTTSEGLNLQHFQEIYFTSPWWNPALEDQAIARSHRIGQTDNVDVFRFAMENFGGNTMTLDQYCLKVQEIKRQIISDYFK